MERERKDKRQIKTPKESREQKLRGQKWSILLVVTGEPHMQNVTDQNSAGKQNSDSTQKTHFLASWFISWICSPLNICISVSCSIHSLYIVTTSSGEFCSYTDSVDQSLVIERSRRRRVKRWVIRSRRIMRRSSSFDFFYFYFLYFFRISRRITRRRRRRRRRNQQK